MKNGGVTGVLLAGGQSKRMGTDKRFIEVEGQTILSRALRILDEVFDEVVISVAMAGQNLPIGAHRVIVDDIPGCATLGGLYTSLKRVTTEWIFCAACDMPFLSAQTIRYVVSLRDAHDYVIPILSTGPQATHACYRKSCLPALESRLRMRDFRLHTLIEEPTLQGRLMPEAELIPYDPQLLTFLNINTPEDLEMVRKLVAQQSSSPTSPL